MSIRVKREKSITNDTIGEAMHDNNNLVFGNDIQKPIMKGRLKFLDKDKESC